MEAQFDDDVYKLRETANNHIEGFKKIDAEEYRIVDKYLDNRNVGFDSFPSEGLWLVHRNDNSKSTSRVFSFEKFKEKPELYPLVDLALRESDISSAILKFVDKKEKTLLELGKCRYSVHELTEFIIKYLVSQEVGGGSKKVLIEKKWITVNGNEHKRT